MKDKHPPENTSTGSSSLYEKGKVASEINSDAQAKCVNEHVSIADEQVIKTINKLYKQYSNEKPDTAIDRQIIAAAHREISAPNLRDKLKTPLWRRLSLPLYVTTVFTFTAIGAHLYWPAPVHVPPGTAAGPVSIDVMNDVSQSNAINLGQERDVREKTKLPQDQELLFLPDTPKTEQQKLEEKINLESIVLETAPTRKLDQISHSQPVNESIKVARREAGSPLLGVHKRYSDKEAWARDIINMFKKGEYTLVKDELVLFKQTFPDYPIDDQIEVFRR